MEAHEGGRRTEEAVCWGRALASTGRGGWNLNPVLPYGIPLDRSLKLFKAEPLHLLDGDVNLLSQSVGRIRGSAK